VVDGVVAHFPLYSSGASEVRKLGGRVSIEVQPLMTLMLGFRELAVRAGTDDVEPSSRRLILQSIKRSKWERKSAPMRGCVTSATTNRHVKSQRNPKLRLSGSPP
jgi:hypothetical protein